MIRGVKLGSHYWVYFSIITMPIVESSHCNSFEERISVDSIWGAPWWRHQMESFSALLAFCAGNSPVTGEFPSQRPVTRSFDIFFELCLNKRLCRQPWGLWCETLSCSLWRHRNIVALWHHISGDIDWSTLGNGWLIDSTKPLPKPMWSYHQLRSVVHSPNSSFIRAGVLVLGNRARSTQVLNFWYSYFTRTCEFHIILVLVTRTRGQVPRYTYEYWHAYWYSMVHLRCKGENNNACEINSLTCHKGKVPNWIIFLWFEYMIRGMWLQIPQLLSILSSLKN